MSEKTIEARVYSVLSKHLKRNKIIAAVIAFAMIAWLLWFAVSLLGNPFAYFIVKNHAEKYVKENYADDGYVLDSVAYVFKNGDYIAHVEKPGSLDYHFSLMYGADGKMRFNTYEGYILNGLNVLSRLDSSYRELADTVLESPAYPYSSYIANGSLAFEGNQNYEQELPKSILVPDALYDIRKLGEQAGYLTIDIDTKEITPEYAAEVLLKIRSLMEQGGVPFYAIDLTLEDRFLEPRDRERLHLHNFRYEDIYEDGLAERVRINSQETERYYAELDAIGKGA